MRAVVLYTAIVVLGASQVACEIRPEPARTHAHLLAVGVRQQAVGVAEHMAARPTPVCGLVSGSSRIERQQAFTTNIRTRLTVAPPTPGQRADVAPLDVDITVRVRRDAQGNIGLFESVRWTENGWDAERSRELRRVHGQWYVREDALPFVAASTHDARGTNDVAESLETWDRLLSLGHGWDIEGDADQPGARTFALADDARPCDLGNGGRQVWWQELVAFTDVVSGSANTRVHAHTGLPSERTLSLQLVDTRADVTLAVTVDETTRFDAPEPVQAPSEVVSDEVDRSFFAVRGLIRRVLRRRVLPPALHNPRSAG